MDPNACLERFYQALAEADYDEAQEAHEDLLNWLGRDGFEPDWSLWATSRSLFEAWELPEALTD